MGTILGAISSTKITSEAEGGRDPTTKQKGPMERQNKKDMLPVWDGHVHPAMFKMIADKDILHSPGNSAQCYVSAWMGGGLGGQWIHVYV